ncbi:uncharacterized protein LOC134524719 [Chroicocephalus ridibundus]|uniref:uncharacterized protein LOC134524719 n=1 Tax=Chroicocephalus ridibundus TaxID=1192867 RepID=UPI002FDEBCDA
MQRYRRAGLSGLAVLLLVAAGRTQVQQEPLAETTEGAGISINCSHPNIKITYFIHWYRQLLGRGPAYLVSSLKDSKELRDPPGRLWVSADRRSSALWLARPRRGDAAVYYCAVGLPREEEPGLQPALEQPGEPEEWWQKAVPSTAQAPGGQALCPENLPERLAFSKGPHLAWKAPIQVPPTGTCLPWKESLSQLCSASAASGSKVPDKRFFRL